MSSKTNPHCRTDAISVIIYSVTIFANSAITIDYRSFTFADEFANRCPKAEKSLLSDSTDIVISDNSEETVKKAAELLKSGGETGIIVRLDESITNEERKSITNDTAEKVGEPLASLSAANRLYGLKIYKE